MNNFNLMDFNSPGGIPLLMMLIHFPTYPAPLSLLQLNSIYSQGLKYFGFVGREMLAIVPSRKFLAWKINHAKDIKIKS